MSEKTACKRCLLKEISETEYNEKLRKYVDGVQPHLKTADNIYEERLSVCRECEYLQAGTCLACGCYVELRAAFKKNKCPYKMWKH